MDAILLLSGNSVRFGENKLCYNINGKKMYQYIWSNLKQCRDNKLINNLIVVTQHAEILQDLQSENCILIENHNPEKGVSYSIFLAVSKLQSMNKCSENCIFSVGDQPYFQSKTLIEFIENFTKNHFGISHCTAGKGGGNPVIFAKKYYKELLELQGDVGGKQIIQKYPQDVLPFQVAQWELEDIDVKPL